jgi:hypothetical protein
MTRTDALRVVNDTGALTAHEITFGDGARLEEARGVLGETDFVAELCRVCRARWGDTYACICGRHRS